jgi:hypothetical protein
LIGAEGKDVWLLLNGLLAHSDRASHADGQSLDRTEDEKQQGAQQRDATQ